MLLKRTPLHGFHKKNGRITEFAGFEMPLLYEGIVPEHLAVRNTVGLFDVTHMGRCMVKGSEATDFLNYILTRDAATTSVGQGKYTAMCNIKGGIIDDLVVFHIENEKFLMVYNASNRSKDYEWINGHIEGFQVEVRDVSDEVLMLAVQGPKATETLQSLVDFDLANLRYYWGEWMALDGFKVYVTRTGYTGEDGFEIYLWETPLAESERAKRLWQLILDAGEEYSIKPCGLGARDTLRLEAGMCLYGNDIDEQTTPLEARLDFIVQFEKEGFIGREALLKQKAAGLKRVLVGARALDRGVPRAGNKIALDGEEIGKITSGTFSPLLRYGICLGYVPPEYSEVGTRVQIICRERPVAYEIVKPPFYDTEKYGRRRKV
jgi:aminomethyltransferase